MNARSIPAIAETCSPILGTGYICTIGTGVGNRYANMPCDLLGTGAGNRWEQVKPGQGTRGGVTVRNTPVPASGQNRGERAPGSLTGGSHG